MVVPFYGFPVVPPVVAGVFPPLSIAVRVPRVAYYFEQMEKSQKPVERKRYGRAYVIEWAYAIAASLGLDLGIFPRVWICDSECIEYLRKFLGFPSVFVDYVDHAVTRVSFKSLVDEISKTRDLLSEYVSYRMGYATHKRSPYATVSSATPGFITVGVVYRFGLCGYYGYSRINVGHVWALEHCVATGILATTDYTSTTPD